MLSSKTNINVFHSIIQKKCQDISLIQTVYDQHILVNFDSIFELVSHHSPFAITQICDIYFLCLSYKKVTNVNASLKQFSMIKVKILFYSFSTDSLHCLCCI